MFTELPFAVAVSKAREAKFLVRLNVGLAAMAPTALGRDSQSLDGELTRVLLRPEGWEERRRPRA